MADVYKTLPPEEAKELGLEIQSSKKADAFVNAFLKRCMPKLRKAPVEVYLHRKAVVLEHIHKKKKRKNNKSKGLTAKERREMRLFEIKSDQQRYNMFLPLHDLWKQYIRDLCNGLRPDAACAHSKNGCLSSITTYPCMDSRLMNHTQIQSRQPQMIQNKLLKADMHGALVMVSKSKCPSYVGLTGIILQETKHVFKIITKEDKLKVVPKLNCVFSVEIDGFITYIYGSKLQMRASERSAKKFKAKGSIDL